MSQGEGVLRFEVNGSSLKLFLNDEIVGFANDTTIVGSGLIGMRGHYDSVLDNFTFAELATVEATLPFKDGFVLANGSSLSSLWSQKVGYFTIVNGYAVASSASVNLAVNSGMVVGDVSVTANGVDFASGTGAREFGLVARYQGVGDKNMYLGRLSNSGTAFSAQIWRSVGGVWTMLARQAVSGVTSSADLRFELQGSSLKLFVDDMLRASATDSTIASGLVGLRSSAGRRVDAFQANAPLVELPFMDKFDGPTGPLTSSDWSATAGVIQDGSRLLFTSNSTEYAFYNNASVSNATLLAAAVDVQIAGSIMGLTARALNSSNQYYGGLVNTNGVIEAQVWRAQGGVWTLLGSRLLGEVKQSYTLLFKVEGNALKLYVNGNLSILALDSSLQGTGLLGIYGRGPASMGDFVAQAV